MPEPDVVVASPPAPLRRRRRGLRVVVAWLPVVGVEVVNIPNESLLAWVVPPFELALWVVAGIVTVRAVGGFRGSAVVRGLVAVVLAAATVQCNNWSIFDPRSYYQSHRRAFAAVADGVRDGSIGTSDAYCGEPLPWVLRDLSTTGDASVSGRYDGRPVVFLPEFVGIPDDAAGYIFYDGVLPTDFVFDLYGAPGTVKGALNLGDGWWYARPGD